MTREEAERFDSKWKQAGECRLWQSPLDQDGYGSFYFRKRGRRAHRVAYFAHKGGIPDGMVIDHICRNRSCVAIGHLRVITVRENTLENSNSLGAINKRKTMCKFGHPLDKFYGTKKKQRYCSICQAAKSRRLHQEWKAEADMTKC